MRSLVALPNGKAAAVVEVYRDGERIVVVTKGKLERETPHGRSTTVGQAVTVCENDSTFEYMRNRAKQMLAKKFERAPYVYAKLCREFGLDEPVSNAEDFATATTVSDSLRAAVGNVGHRQLSSGGGGETHVQASVGGLARREKIITRNPLFSESDEEKVKIR